jgi:hypothetical protein
MKGVTKTTKLFTGIPADVFQMAAVAPDRKGAYTYLRSNYPEMAASFGEFDKMATSRGYALNGSGAERVRAEVARQGWVWSKKTKWWRKP